MGNRVYVGNISYNTNEETLKQVFSGENRTVKRVTIVTDRETGRPRGFAFIIMGNDDEAKSVIDTLHGSQLDGRSIVVNEAQERPQNGAGPAPRPVQQYRAPVQHYRAPVQEDLPKSSAEEFPELIPRNSVRSSGDFKNFGRDKFPAQKWEKKKGKKLTPYEDS
jgi:RNA recognition motif-containing protein